jgi:23S rRNA (guanosine2251-2'-O)-methyltransferase
MNKPFNNTEVLFGIHSVYEALIAEKRKIFEIYAQSKNSNRFKKIFNIAKNRNIPIEIYSSNKLNLICKNDTHQGIAAKTSKFVFAGRKEIFQNKEKGFWLILDGITDPHNLGAIIRTALCAEASGVIIPKDRSAFPTSTVSKISAGALEHIKLLTVPNLVSFIKEIKKENIWIAGLDGSSEKSLFNADFSIPIALVIGSEEKGIRRLVKENCDFLVSIPQSPDFNSLNASVAASIAIYEVKRQRMMAS